MNPHGMSAHQRAHQQAVQRHTKPHHNAAGGWNVLQPYDEQKRMRRKAERYQAKHGLQPKRIRPSTASQVILAPFRLVAFLIKVGVALLLLAFVASVLAAGL